MRHYLVHFVYVSSWINVRKREREGWRRETKKCAQAAEGKERKRRKEAQRIKRERSTDVSVEDVHKMTSARDYYGDKAQIANTTIQK